MPPPPLPTVSSHPCFRPNLTFIKWILELSFNSSFLFCFILCPTLKHSHLFRITSFLLLHCSLVQFLPLLLHSMPYPKTFSSLFYPLFLTSTLLSSSIPSSFCFILCPALKHHHFSTSPLPDSLSSSCFLFLFLFPYPFLLPYPLPASLFSSCFPVLFLLPYPLFPILFLLPYPLPASLFSSCFPVPFLLPCSFPASLSSSCFPIHFLLPYPLPASLSASSFPILFLVPYPFPRSCRVSCFPILILLPFLFLCSCFIFFILFFNFFIPFLRLLPYSFFLLSFPSLPAFLFPASSSLHPA